jgi:hypothetical protein
VPERPVEALGASEETVFAAIIARVVVMPLSAIWKMFGKLVPVPVPPFEACAENESEPPDAGVPGVTEVVAAVRSGAFEMTMLDWPVTVLMQLAVP